MPLTPTSLVQCQQYPTNGEDQTPLPYQRSQVRGGSLCHRCGHFINLLLGRPWIHRNHVVPCTLHQVMKYVDPQGQVRTLVAEQHPFKGVETHFTDSLYQEVNETTTQDVNVSE